MNKKIFYLICLMVFGSASLLRAQTEDAQSPTFTTQQDLEVEKLKLEIERLKLENQRLQLQIQSLQMAKPEEKTEEKKEKKDEKKEQNRLAADMAAKSEELAKQNASDESKIVLDFTNGEIWYKGVRNKMNDFAQLCRDEKWNVKPDFVKFDINGDSMKRYKYQNLYLDRYDYQDKGVFVYEAPQKAGDFSFGTPEGVNQDSSVGEIRNRFETDYFTFEKERNDKDMRILRFKHKVGWLAFDEVLEFWFDQKGRLQKVKWGMLDKK
jgi:hypothetical protein